LLYEEIRTCNSSTHCSKVPCLVHYLQNRFLIWHNWFQVAQLKLRISKRNIKAVIEVFKYFNTA
jgi:hypothetical protein